MWYFNMLQPPSRSQVFVLERERVLLCCFGFWVCHWWDLLPGYSWTNDRLPEFPWQHYQLLLWMRYDVTKIENMLSTNTEHPVPSFVSLLLFGLEDVWKKSSERWSMFLKPQQFNMNHPLLKMLDLKMTVWMFKAGLLAQCENFVTCFSVA